MIAQKLRLLPLEVPWMVSPSTPFLELHTFEMGGASSTFVQLVAHNKPLDLGRTDTTTKSFSVASEPPAFQNAQEGERGAYQLIRLRFTDATEARMASSFTDSQVIDESHFDWSLVSGRKGNNEDIFAFFKRIDESWIRSGICPNPRVYEVLPCESDYERMSSQVPTISPKRRFLVLGHDSYVEVNARQIDIQAGQILAGW